MTATALPEHLRKEIHPDLNDPNLDLNSLSANSKVRIWWQGGCTHVWEASVSNRYHGTGCPVCAGQQVLTGFNDFASQCPEIATQWHPVLNEGILPVQFTKSSNKVVWWLGNCGHEWEAKISSRVKGSGCVYCAGKKVLMGFNDLASQKPEVASLWHPVKNGELSPTMVTPGSNKIAWWLGDCGHEWDGRIADASAGRGCPVCAGKRVLAGFNDLASVNPSLASEWHPQDNGDLLPTMIAGKSGKQAWWLGKCGHTWQATVLSRHQGNGCPICAGQSVLKGFNDLATTHPKIAAQWDAEKNAEDFTPFTVTAGTHRKAWWLSDCGHSWEASITNRTSKGRGCPYCANQSVMVGHNDAGTTHKKLKTEWHGTKNSDKNLSDFTYGSGIKIWWVCENNHEWSATLKDRTRTEATNCPQCAAVNFVSKDEKKIADFLRSKGLTVETTDRTVLPKHEIDIYLPDQKMGIEFNGLYWHSERIKDSKYHYNKWLAAKDKGVQLIQIWEDEWKRNPEQVKAMLLHKLGVSNERRMFARKTYVELLKKSQVEDFLNRHHIQGFVNGSYYLGLLEKGTDELVSVLVLKRQQDSTGAKILDIVRYATSLTVVGGFTKLIVHAEKHLDFDRFITFSDHCVSDGGLYANNGFTADKELAPDYMYVVRNERKHKFGYRLKKFRDDPNLLWQEGLTERELALLNNLPRIWDAGKTRWVRNRIKR